LATQIVLQEIRKEGSPRMPAKIAADLLVNHPGLTYWASHEEGWQCMSVATAAAEHLQTVVPDLRLKHDDWLALLELCLGSEPGFADVTLGRVDYLPWPPFITAMAGQRKKPPSLFTFCARAVVREPSAFPGLTAEQAKLVRRRSAGIGFNAANISEHDPIPKVPAAVCSQQLRSAQPCSRWPHRLVHLAGAPRLVHQRPEQELGTGSLIWGGGLALCEELEERGHQRMWGKRVVELGAGASVVSLCAALLGAKAVISTDLPVIADTSGETLLGLIERNISEHRRALPHFPSQKPVWSAMPLVWGDDEQATEVLERLGGHCDLLLASEVAYDSTSFAALLRTMVALCDLGRAESEPTEVLLCHYPRKQAGGSKPELREFERQAQSAGFSYEVISHIGRTTGVTYEKHVMHLRRPQI